MEVELWSYACEFRECRLLKNSVKLGVCMFQGVFKACSGQQQKAHRGSGLFGCCYKFITVASLITGENKETTSVQNCSHSGG